MTGVVESLVAASNTFLSDAADLIPLGYAFGAGMVATVNPCGFAMLPAYLGLYLGTDALGDKEGMMLRRVGQVLVVSALVTAGFVLLFGVAGLLISAGARALIGYMPWVGLAIGVLLVGTGAWVLGERGRGWDDTSGANGPGLSSGSWPSRRCSSTWRGIQAGGGWRWGCSSFCCWHSSPGWPAYLSSWREPWRSPVERCGPFPTWWGESWVGRLRSTTDEVV